MPSRLRSSLPAAAVFLLAAACDNAGSDLGVGVTATGSVPVQLYLDRDGSRTYTQADTLYPGARAYLTLPAGGAEVKSAQSAIATGIATIEGVGVGDYSVSVDPASLGDSIAVLEISNSAVRIVPDQIATTVTVRLGYPELSLRAARAAPVGKRVMVRGLVLSGLQSFRDTTSHLVDTSTTIRMTRASIRGGGAGNNPGDTVTVLGTVSTRDGQPTLDRAVISVFGQRPAPVPVALTSAAAATAQGGTFDAGLVVVSNMVISESAAQAPDYRLVASDGSGPITIIIDGNITVSPAAVPIGRTISIRGVLVPDGVGGWRLKPRTAGDITLF